MSVSQVAISPGAGLAIPVKPAAASGAQQDP